MAKLTQDELNRIAEKMILEDEIVQAVLLPLVRDFIPARHISEFNRIISNHEGQGR